MPAASWLDEPDGIGPIVESTEHPGIDLDLSKIDDTVSLFPGALSPEQCQEIIDLNAGSEHTVTFPDGCQLLSATIDSEEQIASGYEVLCLLFNLVSQSLGWNIPLDVTRFGLSRYRVGDCMKIHNDDHERGPQAAWNIPHRGVSISIPLSVPGTYEGGRLRLRTSSGAFYEPSVERGTAIAFGSSLPHEVTPVTAGERWVLLGWSYVNHRWQPVR